MTKFDPFLHHNKDEENLINFVQEYILFLEKKIELSTELLLNGDSIPSVLEVLQSKYCGKNTT